MAFVPGVNAPFVAPPVNQPQVDPHYDANGFLVGPRENPQVIANQNQIKNFANSGGVQAFAIASGNLNKGFNRNVMDELRKKMRLNALNIGAPDDLAAFEQVYRKLQEDDQTFAAKKRMKIQSQMDALQPYMGGRGVPQGQNLAVRRGNMLSNPDAFGMGSVAPNPVGAILRNPVALSQIGIRNARKLGMKTNYNSIARSSLALSSAFTGEGNSVYAGVSSNSNHNIMKIKQQRLRENNMYAFV